MTRNSQPDATQTRNPQPGNLQPHEIPAAAAPPSAAIPQQQREPPPPQPEAPAAKPTLSRPREAAPFPFSVTVGRVYDGPLDLLLDLIRKQSIDIWDIPIARITAQFLTYVERLKEADVDNAGEFIYTASLLIHIKSRMLLPRAPADSPDAAIDDPRMELVERLLEHERFKNAAQMLLQKQAIEAATWTRPLADAPATPGTDPGEITADVPDLVRVFRDVLDRLRTRPVLAIDEDSVTVGHMIEYLRRRLLLEDRPVALSRMLAGTRSEQALICMFLALLELVRLGAVLLRQDTNFSEVFIKKHEGFDTLPTDNLPTDPARPLKSTPS